jgi:FkbM family methyltransferase
MHTLLFARLVGPLGHVYAFEPNPEVFAALEEQLVLNSCPVNCVGMDLPELANTAVRSSLQFVRTGRRAGSSRRLRVRFSQSPPWGAQLVNAERCAGLEGWPAGSGAGPIAAKNRDKASG